MQVEELNQNLDTELEHRLNEWARWFAKGCGYKVGYPPTSITFWACYQMAKAKQRNSANTLPSNPPAEEVDDWVRELAKWRPRLAEVLRCHYFTLGPIRDKARRMNISAMQYVRDIERGKAWLICALLRSKEKAQKNI